MSEVTPLEAVKIQAHVIIPVVRALEAELGKAKAHAIVGRAIAEAWANRVASRNQTRDSHPNTSGSGTLPVTSEVVENTDDTYGLNFTTCEFASYFRKIGEPEIGALLTCGIDFVQQAKMRPSWEFTRTQTRMQGAPFCDFRWRLKK